MTERGRARASRLTSGSAQSRAASVRHEPDPEKQIEAPTQAPSRRAGRTTRELRVLDITDFYSETASGGVRTYLRHKMAHLARAGVHHAVVVPGAETGTEEVGGTRLHKIRSPRVPLSPAYRALLSASEVRRVLDRERPDVVEVGSPFFVPWLVRRAGGEPPLPTVGFYHADVVRTFAEPYVQHRWLAPLRTTLRAAARRLVRDVYRTFDATVAASPSVARELGAFGVPGVVHVPLGVDRERFRIRGPGEVASREELGIPEGGVLGVYVGRFAPEKRLDVALDGHARIPVERRPHLLLVGDGPERPALERRARIQEGLAVGDYVSSREGVARIYGAADFYLAPGPGETFGLSIAEALASGLPVVTVGRGAGPDRVAGSTVSEAYRHGDPAEAARAIEALVARLGPGLTAEARRHAEAHYDWDRTFEALLGLYERVASCRR